MPSMQMNECLPEDTRRYLESHPSVAEQLQRAEKVYANFYRYLSLTQSRVVIRESNASTAEIEPIATISRTDL